MGARKKEVLNYPIKNINRKYNEIKLPKNKMDLNDRKMKNHPLSPEGGGLGSCHIVII